MADDDALNERLSRIEEMLTPGVQRADRTTADLETKIEGQRVDREEMADKNAVNLAARLASLKIVEDNAAAQNREEAASKLAYERGVEAAKLDSRLSAHDNRFALINGSMEKVANELVAIKGQIVKIENLQNTRDEIQKALADSVQKSSAAQLSARQFFMGLAGLVMAMCAIFATLLAAHVI